MAKTIIAADLFCGAGGTSTGLAMACRELGLKLELTAVNHWDVAIATHSKNHPDKQHLCESLDNIDPKKLIPGGRLNLLVASPPCQHHSRARGGKPMSDQMRSSAWRILDWATDLYIDSILMENVREWQEWGPLGVDGKPLKSKKGETFQAFLTGLRGLGYKVEYKVLNAADYGDPTTRERLFVICRRGNKSISWPVPTHGPRAIGGQTEMFGSRQNWRAAREIIDWTIPGKSIFTRKKPLAPATMERIAAGLRKFGGANAEPFLVILRNHMNAHSLDQPLPTVTADGTHHALCEPFIAELRNGKTANSVDEPVSTVTTKGAHHALIEPFVLGQQSQGAPRSTEEPIPTVAGAGAIALVEPFILPQFSDATPRSIDRPLGVVTTTSRGMGLVEPFIVTANHGTDKRASDGTGHARRSMSVEDPLGTVTGSNSFAVVEPFVVPMNRAKDQPRSVDDPLRTVTATSADMGLVEPFIIAAGGPEGQGRNARSVDDPLCTVMTDPHQALVEPFIVPFFGEAEGQTPRSHSIDNPLPAVTSHGAGALVEPYVIPTNHGKGDVRSHDIEDPMPTITSVDAWAVIEPFLTGYYGNGDNSAVSDPVPTITTKDRFGLVEPDSVRFDIRFRMLQPHELALAQGFPVDYAFTGNREQVVKQIGNAVPVNLARALCGALLSSAAAVKEAA